MVAAALGGCTAASRAQRADEAVALAQHQKEAKRLPEAAAAYGDALDLDPGNLVALRGYVETRQKLGRLHESQDRFEHQVALAPGDAFGWEGLGLTLYAMGGSQGAAAEQALAKAAALSPGVADFHYRLGVLLVESDRWQDAKKELAAAVAQDARRARFRLPYALALARTGDRTGAVAQLDAVLALQPTREEVAQAEKTARMLVDPFRGFPQAAREQFEMALAWLGHDSLGQAQQVLESLLEKYPDLAIVHATNGLCAARMDDAGRAIVELRRASELDPELAEPRLFLGDLYAARGRPEEAREHYEAALARNPFLPDAYRRLAEQHLKDGDKDKAVSRFETYLLLRPDDFEAQVARASLLGELGRGQAGEAWDETVRAFPRRVDALVGRARWYFTRAARSTDAAERRAAVDRARTSLEKALEVDPENQAATTMLSELRKLPR